jgi:hypothetical protein
MRSTAIWLLFLSEALSPGQSPKPEPIANPSSANSSQVNWSLTQDGSALLSWLESDTLKYAIRRDGRWSEARTIASHRHFFHPPAELPEVVSMPNGAFMAHWIETPKPDSEAEFVYVSASRDGVKWSAPAAAQRDKSDVEHGLASMVSNGDGTASVFFLQSLKGPDAPTTLARSVIGANGTELKEETLDTDVCECCPTAAVNTAKGLLVGYRDHTKDDIRDIATVRFEGGKWLASKIVYPDGWKVDACPVNAAVAAAKGEKVAIAWYTASGNKPRVEVALSADSGATFGKAVVVSTGSAYGYASVALDDAGGAYVSWLERGGDNAKVFVRHVSANGATGPVTQVVEGTRKSLGYPRLVRAGGNLLIGWNTDTAVMTAKLGM